jgi:hypothetical protein
VNSGKEGSSFGQEVMKSSMLKILVAIPHFYNVSGPKEFLHSSRAGVNMKERKFVVSQSINSYKTVFNELGLDGEILLIGDPTNSLFTINVDVSNGLSNSLHIPWKAIDHIATFAKNYDFVVIAEDDIEVNSNTFRELISLETKLSMSDLVIPNRIEYFENEIFCVDLLGEYRWKFRSRKILGEDFRRPLNLHSGFLLLSSAKFQKAYELRKFKFPTEIGNLGYLESALFNLAKTFKVYRKIPVNSALSVTHLDGWLARQVYEERISYRAAIRLIVNSNTKGKSFLTLVIFVTPISRIFFKLRKEARRFLRVK